MTAADPGSLVPEDGHLSFRPLLIAAAEISLFNVERGVGGKRNLETRREDSDRSSMGPQLRDLR